MRETLAFCRDPIGVVLARHRALGWLDSLSERYLADMGREREDIPADVRSAWPWPRPPFQAQPRCRPSLRGCG